MAIKGPLKNNYKNIRRVQEKTYHWDVVYVTCKCNKYENVAGSVWFDQRDITTYEIHLFSLPIVVYKLSVRHVIIMKRKEINY